MPEKIIEATPLNAKKAMSIMSKEYWLAAAKNFSDVRMICYAAIIIALRVALKFIVIPVNLGVDFSFDCYINSLGSLVYGPLVGLAVGAVSDTLGCILHPTGPYFFPFILTEMSSSFIFALFLWKRDISAPRVLLSKFTVNFVCNIIITSLLMKPYMSIFYGKDYNLVNMTRIVKNLVLFPLEAMFITFIFAAMIPALRSMKLVSSSQKNVSMRTKDIILMVGLTVLSVGLVLLYVFWLKDFISAHNIKLF